MTLRRSNMGISLAIAILGGMSHLADRAAAAAVNTMQKVDPFQHVRSHARFNGGRASGCAAARREKRRRRNIAKHPRGAA